MLYPYKIHVKDPEIVKILQRLAKDRTVTINGNKSAYKKLTYKLIPIRSDLFIGYDKLTKESNISLKDSRMKIEIDKEKKRFRKCVFKML